MQLPVNPFKKALKERRPQIGLWQGLASPYSTEICAGAGFDWLLLDGEHSPNDLMNLLQMSQVVAGYPGVNAVARIPLGAGNVGQMLCKQYLDLGIQNLLVPMVDTAEQARDIVRWMRYPPQGIRGVAGARGSRWGRYPNYVKEANDQVCLLVQVETQQALDNLDAIIDVEGVDGVFIGPSDLSASLGYVGQATHPEVFKVIEGIVAKVNKAGKAAGILSLEEQHAKHWLSLGVLFVAVGTDVSLLAKATSGLAAKFKDANAPAPATNSTLY
jgi:4-hydroxy-2-oxoheptanedioate aldolase